ncbi:hypothetical protein CEP53_005113 [Fusarium sp. AF-6]|nr:hypothetical protein CEP53_005113 [Fusarium sp. AF-6]
MCQLHSLTNITSTMADDCLGHLGLLPQCGICDDVILRHERVIALIGNTNRVSSNDVYLSLALVEGTRIAMKLFELESETSRPI